MLNQLLISVVTSSVVTGILVFCAKSFFSRWLDHEFEKRHVAYLRKMHLASKTEEALSATRLGLYPELIEIGYRLKNAMLDACEASSAAEWAPEVRELTIRLVEDLYRNRIYLSDDIFNPFHKLKHISQDAMLIGDTFSRVDKINDTVQYEEAMKTFRPKADSAAVLFTQAKEAIDIHLAKLQGQ